MKAMILAAGKGERMRPLTLQTPKPLVPVNNQPLVVYHIKKLARAGIKEIIINHSWLSDQFFSVLGNGSQWGVQIYYSKEEVPLGTGGGIMHALNFFKNSPFLLLSADIATDYPFSQLINKQLDKTILGHLVLVKNPSHNPEGDYMLNDNFIERKSQNASSLTFASIALLTPKMIHKKYKPPISIADFFNNAIKKKRLTGEYYDGYHCNVDTLERRRRVENDRRNGLIDDNKV